MVSRDDDRFVNVFNAGRSDIKGLEVFVEKDLNQQLTLNLGAAYTDGKYKDFVTGDGQDMSGESFLYSPKYKATVGGTYRFTNGVTFNSDIVYQDGAPSQYEFDSTGQVSGQRDSAAYVLVNFNTEYQVSKNVAVSGYLKNAFDHEYMTNNRAGNTVDVGAPRTMGLVLRYDM